MIKHVGVLVLALFATLTSIIVVNVTALPATLLHDHTTLSDSPPGVINRRGNELSPRSLTRSQSDNNKKQYSNLLMATVLNTKAKQLLDAVKTARISPGNAVEVNIRHYGVLMLLVRDEIDRHRLEMLGTIISQVHPEQPQIEMWEVPASAQLDIDTKAKKLCYTPGSPTRKTVDVLEQTSKELSQIVQDIVEGYECQIIQFIIYLNDLCELVYPGEPIFSIEDSQVDRKQVIPSLLSKSLVQIPLLLSNSLVHIPPLLSMSLVRPLLGHPLIPRTASRPVRPRPTVIEPE